MGSSQTRARTCVPCISRQILNHCATREVSPGLLEPKLPPFCTWRPDDSSSSSRANTQTHPCPLVTLGSYHQCWEGRTGSPLCGPGEAFWIRGVCWVLITEQYNPPNNITVYCNESHCFIQWEKPRTRKTQSIREFQYQLDIQRQVSGHCSKRGTTPQEAWQPTHDPP